MKILLTHIRPKDAWKALLFPQYLLGVRKNKTTEKSLAMLKLEKNRIEQDQETDSTLEAEGDAADINLISRKTQTYQSDVFGTSFTF